MAHRANDIDRLSNKFRKELLSGTTSLVLLSLIARSGRAMYGYEIAKELEGAASESLTQGQGALYPALRSMERQGLLASTIKPSVAGPPRKYYRVTPAGRKTLRAWAALWHATSDLVESTLEGTENGRTRRRVP